MDFLKRLWKKLWSKTEVDDIAIERAKQVKEEPKAGDVVDAAKGKKRRGRPRKDKK